MNTRVSDLPDLETLDGSEYMPVVKGVRTYKATISQIGSTGVSGVSSVNTRTGAVVLSKTDVGLGNVDNTADASKPLSTAVQAALNGKVATTDPRLSDARMPTEHTHAQSEVVGLSDALSGKASSVHSHVITDVTDLTTALAAKEATANKGMANGYASLDSGGKVPVAQLPSSIMEYKGTWNASTNTPTLTDGSGDIGDIWRVSVAGTQTFGGVAIDFEIGDYCIYNGTIYERSGSTDAVSSVDGLTGDVDLSGAYLGINGNAATASKASQQIVGTCNEVTGGVGIVSLEGFEKIIGVSIYVLYGTNSSHSQLNINGTGIVPIVKVVPSGVIVPDTVGQVLEYVYDGISYVAIKKISGIYTLFFNSCLQSAISDYSKESTRPTVSPCSTQQLIIAKTVSSSYFTLVSGARAIIIFTYAAISGATLNINSTGAKSIYKNGSAATSDAWTAGDIVEFIYDGSYYHILSVKTPGSTQPQIDSTTVKGTIPATTGLAILDDATPAEARTTLGLGTASTVDLGANWSTALTDAKPTTLSGYGITDEAIMPQDGIGYWNFATMPEIPDNVAGTTYRQDEWATLDGWTGGGTGDSTIAVSSGMLTSTVNTGKSTWRADKVAAFGSGKIYRAKILSPQSGAIGIIAGVNGDAISVLTEIPIVANTWKVIDYYIAGAVTELQFRQVGMTAGDVVYIDWVYVGTGAIDSPIIDNSGNGIHLTARAVLPVEDATVGRAVKLNGATSYTATQDIQEMPDVLDLSFWANTPLHATQIQILAAYGTSSESSRFLIYKIANSASINFTYGLSSSITITSLLPHNAWTHLRFNYVWLTGVLTVFRNGTLFGTYNTATGLTKPSGKKWYFGNQEALLTTQAAGGYLAHPRTFDRALSANEVQGLYRGIESPTPYTQEMYDTTSVVPSGSSGITAITAATTIPAMTRGQIAGYSNTSGSSWIITFPTTAEGKYEITILATAGLVTAFQVVSASGTITLDTARSLLVRRVK